MWQFAVLALAQLVCLVPALSPAEWQSQSIYFVLTDRFARTDGSTDYPCNTSAPFQYCGGTWQGIINHLDYIQGMGFTAIWITPVTHNIQTTPAYHGYWQDDLYDVNPEYGTPSDLRNLSDALHGRGMYLMLDVVANHFAWTGAPNTTDYSTYVPFNDVKYFHEPMTIDYDNQTSIEVGWLVVDPTPVVLPDVNTTREDVRELYYSWITDLVANYSADGIRIDTVKHVEQPFWSGFNEAAGVYAVGEVFNTENITYLCDYQNYLDGVLNYGPYLQIRAGFTNSSGNLFALADAILEVQDHCKNISLLGSFMENHDNPRFPNITTDIALAANAISFTMLTDGIPIIYQGQEQHLTGGQDPANREAIWLSGYATDVPLYRLITTLNKVRANAVREDDGYLNYPQTPVYADPNTLVMRKGPDGSAILSVYSNLGSDGEEYTVVVSGLRSGYSAGSTLVDVLTCDTLTVGDRGSVSVPVTGGQPKVYYPQARLHDLCGS